MAGVLVNLRLEISMDAVTGKSPDLDALTKRLLTKIEAAADLATLEAIRVSALGKKGEISELLRQLGTMPPEARKSFGAAVNVVKDRVAAALETRKAGLEAAELAEKLATDRADISLPVRPNPAAEGRIHPISRVWEELMVIFADMGFAVAEGPDIETDDFNFTRLNFPPGHPARDAHDTFFFAPNAEGERLLLRTHTSPVQVRTMLGQKPPLKIIAPGRVYRMDSDQTHTPMFHQVEGLVIDRGTHMGHMKWVLEEFCKAFFEVASVKMRFRMSYFPFTEPSAEVDIQCDRSGPELKFGEGSDWLEILGCGMVHPNVLTACGIDPDEWQGFAFGMGIDRIAALKYGMPDLRAFFSGDLRWLKHYGFSPLAIASLAGGLAG
jgi:phenylalanyl-tRNA synthetase alpha chain